MFQRASTVSETSVHNSEGSINFTMAPFPIAEYFQSTEADPRKQGGITTAFANVLNGLSSNSAMTYSQQGAECGDSCTGKVKVCEMRALWFQCNSC